MLGNLRIWSFILIASVAWAEHGSASTQDTATCPDESGKPLPLAPSSARIDRYVPTFSTPLAATNRLNPIAQLDRVILLGSAGGARFRVETTLLPQTKRIRWAGREIEALVSQYVAFAGGRIEEVALDWYAQADDGTVWYLGEDVFNYEKGVLKDTEGTWRAGRDGPGAMIMGAAPKVGQAWRSENICGLVFEEITVKSTGVTVPGPRGPVSGAIIVEELHQDATREEKIFAPGYGEFSTGDGTDLEAVAMAVPIDALGGALPVELARLSAGADQLFDAVGAGGWSTAAATLGSITEAWNRFRGSPQPPKIVAQMDTALAALAAAVAAKQPGPGRQAAIDVARVALDFRLRYEPRAAIDHGLLLLWVRQLLLDTEAGDRAGISGDIVTLKWMRDRIVTDAPALASIDAALAALRSAATARDLPKVKAARADLEVRLTAAARSQGSQH